MAKPGIMIYFEVREPLKVLSAEDKGKLFDAILEYGEFGTVPDFTGMLEMAWGFIRPKLDRDSESYEIAVLQRKYAAFCKKLSNMKSPKISFEEWKNMTESERERMVTTVDFRYPTTTSTVTPTTTTSATITPTTTATATPTATGKRPLFSGNDEPEDFEAQRIKQMQRLLDYT